MHAASSVSSRSLSLRSMTLSLSSSDKRSVAETTEFVVDVLTCIILVLLCVLLCRLHQLFQRRKGYSEIKIAQDDHVLYSETLRKAKDSWETIPLHSGERKK